MAPTRPAPATTRTAHMHIPSLEAPAERGAGEELLRLLQLSSSLCPIGAFAFSQGLEQAVERGWVSNEAQLTEWLLGLGRHALARLELSLPKRPRFPRP